MRTLLSLRRGLPLVALTAAFVLLGSAGAQEAGFTPLFNGKDFKGLKTVGVKDDTFKVVNGEIHSTGKPNGYFATEKSFKNYHLKFDWKYVRPEGLKDEAKFNGNSGCLVHITGDHKVWPKCVEVQGMNRDMCKIFAIGGAKGKFTDEAAARMKARKPVGEWNTVEVISHDGKLTSILNGTKIAEGESDLKEGSIGWQAEGAPIHFRRIMIHVADK